MPPVVEPTSPPAVQPRSRVVWVLALLVVAAALAAAWFGIPAWHRHQRQTHAVETAALVEQFVAIFDGFAHAHGEWPVAAAPGTMPTGMESALRDTAWTKPAPIGGKFAWGIDAGGVHAGISVVSADSAHPLDSRSVEELLRTLKSRGFPQARLRLNARNEPMFVLED